MIRSKWLPSHTIEGDPDTGATGRKEPSETTGKQTLSILNISGRFEIVDVIGHLLKHHWHAESVAGSTENIVLSIPIAPTIGPREFGTAPAARKAQVVGGASAGAGS
jgi:hypothetical protein